MRHMHEKIKVLEERTAPKKEDGGAADATAAAVLGGMIMGDTLMIQNGPYGESLFCF